MIDVALKEWSVVCDLLVEGGLALLMRKGGIHEDRGPGVFRMEHPRFLLFPAWEHQKPEMIKPAYRDRVQVLEEPASVTFRGYAEPAKIWSIGDKRHAVERLDDLHCWTKAHLDMRFNYKPENPLYLVALRAYRLNHPKAVVNNLEYGGCRSWVPLEPNDAVDETDAVPALRDEQFQELLDRVDDTLRTAEQPTDR